MTIVTMWRSIGKSLVGTCALTCALYSAAGAASARAPQIPLQTGWDGYSLQAYMNGCGQAINTLADQVDYQTWQSAANSTATFALRVELAGNARSNSVGIYNASQTNPLKFLVFPGAAAAGWYATCAFGTSGQMVVRLFDQHNVLQGITNYSGVDRSNFGFYLQGPAGTFWSQDSRNAGGKPQAVTFAGTGSYAGRWWECFEDLPYATSDVDFQDSILLLEAVAPTPVRSGSWSAVKALYR